MNADEVRDQGRPTVADPRRHWGWLTAAAVFAVVAGLAATVLVAVRSDDDTQQVATDAPGEDAGGTPVQIVVVAPDLDPSWWRMAHTVSLIERCAPGDDDCGDGAPLVATALEPGTSLAVHRRMAPGPYELSIVSYDCGDDCGPPGEDGRPTQDGVSDGCGVELDVGADPTRIVVDAGPTPDGWTECAVRPTGDVPDLTVPPAWSVRDPLPWACGNAAHDINRMMGGDDPNGAAEALQCFRSALADGRPAELRVSELQAADGLTRSWWRSLPEPVDGHGLEVIRDVGLEGVVGWAVVRCDDLDVEVQEFDPSEVGGPSGYVGASPVGCSAEEPLSLELPPLGPPAPPSPSTSLTAERPPSDPPASGPAPTTGGQPPAPGTVDVVLDIGDLPAGTDPVTWSWGVHLGDEDVASTSGLLVGDDADGYPWAQVALVASDLQVPEGTEWVGLMVDDRQGTASMCVGGLPPADAPEARVLVVRIAERGCDPEWTTSLPTLTVPPTWSLRQPPASECIDLAATARWGQCLADAAVGGDDDVAEWSVGQAGVMTTYRVEAEGVTVVRRVISPDSIDWTRQECLTLEVTDGGRGVEPADCDHQVALTLEP